MSLPDVRTTTALQEMLDGLREQLSELRRRGREAPHRRQELLGEAFDALQARLDELRVAERCLQEERDGFERSLRDALDRERQARVAAEAANAANDEFLATVSHELRTPLTSILGWTRILQTPDEDRGPTITLRALGSIERNARTQARLVEDLLDSAQLTLGRLRINSRDVEIGAVVGATIEVVKPTADAKQVELAVGDTSDVLVVWGDPVRLQQVLWNLVSNALKFTPAGGRVEVETRALDETVSVTVRDSGIGIDAAMLPYIFDRFRRGDATPTRRYAGLGLGLSIARQLVEAHGGTIAADSQGQGHGSVFTVTLPLRNRFGERRTIARPLSLFGERDEGA